MRSEILGTLLVIGGATLWGSAGVLGKLVMLSGLDPISTVFLRVSLATPLLLLLAIVLESDLKPKADLLILRASLGLIGIALSMGLFFRTIYALGVIPATLLLYTAPAHVLWLAWLILGESLTLEKILSLISSMLGVFFIVTNGSPELAVDASLLDIILGVLTGVAYAGYFMISRYLLHEKGDDPVGVVAYSFIFGSIFLSPLSIPRILDGIPRSALPYLAGLVIVATFSANLLHALGLRFVEASKASIYSMMEPLVGSILAWLVLGERITIFTLVGGSLIFLGVYLAYRSA